MAKPFRAGKSGPAALTPNPGPEDGQNPSSHPEVRLESSSGVYETLAGVIVGAHGVQGSLKVRPATPTSSGLFVPDENTPVTVWVGLNSSEGALRKVLTAKRQEPKGLYIIRLEGVSDRTAAEQMMGQLLFAPDTKRAPLQQDEYFVEDLIGLNVVDKAGVELGTVTAVHSYPAHDVYETDRDVLIPAVREFVAEVDLPGRRLIVHDAQSLKIDEPDG